MGNLVWRGHFDQLCQLCYSIAMDMERTIRLIQLEEGCRLDAYKDSRGIWTVGWGHNLEAHGYDKDEAASVTWTQSQADEALRDEVDLVLSQIDKRWPEWRNLDDVRQAAIVSSVYQLGAPGAAKFFATIAALKARDFDKAADQMLASRWAKQTPRRVARNATMIRTGRWPKDVNGIELEGSTAPHPQPAAPIQSASRPGDAGQKGLEMGGTVREGLFPVPVSKKLSVAIVGLLAVILNQPLGLGLSDQQMSDLVKLVSAYVIGQAGVDAFGPFIKTIGGSK